MTKKEADTTEVEVPIVAEIVASRYIDSSCTREMLFKSFSSATRSSLPPEDDLVTSDVSTPPDSDDDTDQPGDTVRKVLETPVSLPDAFSRSH